MVKNSVDCPGKQKRPPQELLHDSKSKSQRSHAAGSDSASTNVQLEWARNTLQGAGFEVQTSIHVGDLATVLGAYVREQCIDMPVMGAYGHSRISQLLVGSTTTSMMRTTSAPPLLRLLPSFL